MSDPMPKRPTQHELKTQSARAFEALLPPGWTAQPRDDDYGIDFDVEIFRGGTATGLGFHVQLKGTRRVRNSPTATVKWATRNYWLAQQRPTLVVLWEAETGRVWAEWSHRADLFGVDKSASKTFQFPFPAKPWSADTPRAIEAEVKAFHAWSSARNHLPITVVVTGLDAEVAGVPSGLVHAAVRQRLRDFHSFVKVQPDPTDPLSIEVRLAREQTVLWLSGGPSATLHHEGRKTLTYARQQKAFAAILAADISLLIAYQLSLLRLDKESARLAESVLNDSSLVRTMPMASGLLHFLCEQERVSAAIALTQRLLYEGGEGSADLVPMALMDAARNLDRDGRRRISDAFLRWGNEYESSGNPTFGAAFAYNASCLIGADDKARVLHLLDRAAELDPAYRHRGYWWRERAGMLFLAGQFDAALDHYRQAVDLGAVDAVPLLGDAELFSGNYDTASTIFEAVAGDPALSRAEWRLKAQCVRALTTVTGLARQVRDVSRVTEAVAGTDDESLGQKELQALLSADLLNPEVLFRLGDAAQSSGESAFDFHLMSALIDPTKPVAWLRCLSDCAAEAPGLLADVATCARRWVGEDLIDMLLEDSRSAPLARVLEAQFAELPEEAQALPVVRIVTGGSGEVTIVQQLRHDVPPDPEEFQPVEDDDEF